MLRINSALNSAPAGRNIPSKRQQKKSNPVGVTCGAAACARTLSIRMHEIESITDHLQSQLNASALEGRNISAQPGKNETNPVGVTCGAAGLMRILSLLKCMK